MIKKAALFLLAILFFKQLMGQQPDSLFLNQLNSLKSNDELATWLDSRINYTIDAPMERLDFLMQSNKAAWRSPKTTLEKESWLYLLINQGYYQLLDGDILKSINCYEQALSFQNKHQLNINTEEYIYKPLSNNYTRLGDYERAIYLQTRSLQNALKNNNIQLAASTYANLATSYRSKNELSNSLKATQSGLLIANKSSSIYALLLLNLAEIQKINSNYKESLSHVQDAISNLKKQSKNSLTSYWLLGAYTLAGDICTELTDLTKAQVFYLNALNLLKNQNIHKREASYVFSSLGSIELKQKNYHAANRYYTEALQKLIRKYPENNLKYLPAYSDLFAENKLQKALEGKADALEGLNYKEESLKAALLAFEVSEKIRSEFTYTLSKEQLQSEAKALAEKAIDKAFILWKKSKKEFYANTILLLSEKTKARILADEMLKHQLENKAFNKNPDFQKKLTLERSLVYYQKLYQEDKNLKISNKITDIKFQISSIQRKLNLKNYSFPYSSKELLSNLEENTNTLLFFTGKNSTYQILANKSKILLVNQIKDTPKLEKSIANYLETYFYNGAEAMINNPKGFFWKSNDIYEQIFKLINYQTKPKLLIVKDGIFNYLPFESLVSESIYKNKINEWPYLLKKAEIRYSFSLNSLIKSESRSNNNSFSGIFLSKTQQSKSSLPSVVNEYQQIKQNIQGDYFLDEEVTLKNFKAAINKANILHISSHAYFGKNTKEPLIQLYNNKLYLLELASLKVSPKLVVLSACQTADGKFISGEGVYSLSRGFIASGAGGVISSLWKVNDQSSSLLMTQFYQNLIKDKNPATALRNIKLKWLEGKTENKLLYLPYYWDGLIYTGIHQKVEITKKNNFWPFILASLLTICALIIWLKKTKRFPNR